MKQLSDPLIFTETGINDKDNILAVFYPQQISHVHGAGGSLEGTHTVIKFLPTDNRPYTTQDVRIVWGQPSYIAKRISDAVKRLDGNPA